MPAVSAGPSWELTPRCQCDTWGEHCRLLLLSLNSGKLLPGISLQMPGAGLPWWSLSCSWLSQCNIRARLLVLRSPLLMAVLEVDNCIGVLEAPGDLQVGLPGPEIISVGRCE